MERIIKKNKMTIQRVIILTNGTEQEAWGSLTQLCRVHGFSYNYLKTKTMPFSYKGLYFNRVPFRARNKKLLELE